MSIGRAGSSILPIAHLYLYPYRTYTYTLYYILVYIMYICFHTHITITKIHSIMNYTSIQYNMLQHNIKKYDII